MDKDTFPKAYDGLSDPWDPHDENEILNACKLISDPPHTHTQMKNVKLFHNVRVKRVEPK